MSKKFLREKRYYKGFPDSKEKPFPKLRSIEELI